MRHGLFTLTLAVALPACSKPNPLFLDTWEGLSEGATLIDTGQTASEPTSASDSSVPTTSEPTTTTTTTEPTTQTTTAGPTGTSSEGSSTGQVPPCSETEELVIRGLEATADAFLIREVPTGGCTVIPAPGENCILRNWGAADFNDLAEGTDQEQRSYLALRFERDAIVASGLTPDDTVKSVKLQLTFLHLKSFPDGTLTKFVVTPFTPYAEQDRWEEGIGFGDPVMNTPGVTYACRQWVNECVRWDALGPDSDEVKDVKGPLFALEKLPIGTFEIQYKNDLPDEGHIIATMTVANSITVEQLLAAFVGDLSMPMAFGPGVLVKPAAALPYGSIGVKASEVVENKPEWAPMLLIERCLN